ncbi:MAG: cysteine synthase A [Gammaproteobacteria bacterium]
MKVSRSFLEAVGDTPLIYLKGPSEQTCCEIYGKAEFANPGGSIKDRAAVYMIRDAQEKGLLQPGGILVEGTAGNTGIGLTLAANSLGYASLIVMPETQTDEKKNTLRALGADLRLVPAVPYKDDNNYVKYAGRLAAEYNRTHAQGAVWANQFDNLANKRAHYETTGPEIWQQMEGQLDGFCCAVGTGGSISGISAFLRSQKPDIKIALADPPGAALHNYYCCGELKAEGSSLTEGIGQGRITANLEGFAPDYSYSIPDQETLDVMFAMCRDEGLYLGGSSAINIAGTIRMAREMGANHRLVTLLCDQGDRYLSKLYNRTFLEESGFSVPDWL